MNNRNTKRKYRGGRPPLPPEKRKVRCNVTLSRNTLKILSGISSNRSEAIEIVSGFFSGFLDDADDGVVKRELTDAEIEELGARAAEKRGEK